MWEKFQKFLQCRLQDISIWSDKNLFGGPMKKEAIAHHKVTYVLKNVQNGGTSL